MGSLTTAFASKIVDHNTGAASYTPTGPLKAALVTVLGSASAAGTEVTGGSYARQTVTFGSASGGIAANTGAVTFTLPACTVVGIEIYDSNGTPFRMLWGALTSRTFVSGDTFTLAIGAITFGES